MWVPEVEWGENEVKAFSDAVGLMRPQTEEIYTKTDVGLNQSCVRSLQASPCCVPEKDTLTPYSTG